MFRLKIPKQNCLYKYRKYSTTKSENRNVSAAAIRRAFLDYFIENHHHRFIRSSPVVPFCDPTVPFVNAGMNQFKNIFLGKSAPPCKRAANSQKCIRISGKHNDLNIIGTDGYHHTFFEMLGNWSFGDYYKEEACKMAWELLTKSFGIDPNRLYVTYFNGDERFGLQPDFECKEIWQKIGVRTDHILPFGYEHNFWEMGLCGPCGPCTEIHIDHLPVQGHVKHRAKFVNADYPDLTELWNIVFISYNRQLNGEFELLKEKFVDTGMGFERLVAVMQGKFSNYDTDLFMPIFNAMSKEAKIAPYSGAYNPNEAKYELDYAYRVVADHTRMCAVCIADGMYPQTNNRLRKIARKALDICETTFKSGNLMQNAVVPEIVATLGAVYPELEKNFANIRETLNFESENFKSLRARNRKEFHTLNISSESILCEEDTIDYAGFPIAYRDVNKFLQNNASIQHLPIDFVYDRLHVALGLNEELIEKIAQHKQLKIDWDAFSKHKQQKKLEAKIAHQKLDRSVLYSIDQIAAPPTDSSFVYDYRYDANTKEFNVQKIEAKIEMIKSSSDNVHHIILDRTNFYHTAGGQDGDIGHIIDSNGTKFTVDAVEMYKGYVFHIGRFANAQNVFDNNQMVELHVNAAHRTGLTQHHTAMHLLQAAVKAVTGQITFQQSSHISNSKMKCDLGTIGARIDLNQLTEIEQLVQNVIHADVPVHMDFLSAHDLYAVDNLTIIPGEIYPDKNIRVLSIKYEPKNFQSIEPCCGTHVRRTGELEDFCLTGFKFNANSRSYNINAVAGPLVATIKQNESAILNQFDRLTKQIAESNDHASDCDWKALESKTLEFEDELNRTDIPYGTRARIDAEIDEMKKQMHLRQRAQLRSTIIAEMVEILRKRIENNASFVVHILYTTEALEETLIADAEKVCHDLPVIILYVSNNKIVHGLASVPIKYATNQFNAKHWLDHLGKTLRIKCQPNKKKRQFARSTLHDIPDKSFTHDQLGQAVENAKIAAENAFNDIIAADQSNRQMQELKIIDDITEASERLLTIENNIEKLVEMEAETKAFREHLKNNLFLYTTKQKCMADIAQLDEKIFAVRSKIEKNLVAAELSKSSQKNSPFIVTTIQTKYILGNKTMMYATDLLKEIPVVVVNITDTEVVGRISIPSVYTNDAFRAIHLSDVFSAKFDGKCIHDGQRYDASVCDFRLNKTLVNDSDLDKILENIKDILKKMLNI